MLERCLEALVRQTLMDFQFEILVCDDADSEETRKQVERFAITASVDVRYLRVGAEGSGRHGPAAARNAGWRNARAPWIAFTDDDTIPAPDWLEKGLQAVEWDSRVIALAGQVQVPRPLVPTDYERDIARMEEAEFVTANCFVRRIALEAVGGFDERFTAAWREDSDLHFSLLRLAGQQGGRLERSFEAVVVHPVRPAHWGISLSLQRKARFNALLYKKHPRHYRARIQRRPPIRYYFQALALIFAGVAALRGERGLSVQFLLFWALLTAEFCARRLSGSSLNPSHVLEMIVTSALIPFFSIYWRLRGAWEFRVLFF